MDRLDEAQLKVYALEDVVYNQGDWDKEELLYEAYYELDEAYYEYYVAESEYYEAQNWMKDQ